MPALEQIIGIINTTLSSSPDFSGMKFQNTNWSDIAENNFRSDDSSIIPVLINSDGTCTQLSLDGKFNLQIYHRIDNTQYEIYIGDYGSPGNIMKETASCRMVLYGDRQNLGVRYEDILAYVMLWFPKQLAPSIVNPLGLSSLNIELGTVDIDPMSVFNKEYKNVEYTLKPNNFMLDISYKIITTFNKNCYNIPGCN